MIKLVKKTFTNKGIRVDFKTRKSSWMAGLMSNLLDTNNQDMLKTYLRLSCKDMQPFLIKNEDMSDVVSKELNQYTVYITDYKKKDLNNFEIILK